MAKRIVKVDLYRYSPEKLLKTLESVVARNTHLGPASPFTGGALVDMDAFADKVAAARAKRTEALEYYAKAEAAMNESQNLLGNAAGQSMLTTDTCLNYLGRIKRTLLVQHNKNPEALSLWGFDVKVGEAKSRRRKKK